MIIIKIWGLPHTEKLEYNSLHEEIIQLAEETWRSYNKKGKPQDTLCFFPQEIMDRYPNVDILIELTVPNWFYMHARIHNALTDVLQTAFPEAKIW